MKCYRALLLSTVVVAFAGFMPAGFALAAEADDAAVQEANDQFYTALNAMFEGNVAPMTDVWSHADDVTYMGPGGGMQIGWDATLAVWEEQAAKLLGGRVTQEATHYNVGQEIAVVSCYEVGKNVVNGEPRTVNLRATNVFRKENGQWKMIGHHTDLLPFLAQ